MFGVQKGKVIEMIGTQQSGTWQWELRVRYTISDINNKLKVLACSRLQDQKGVIACRIPIFIGKHIFEDKAAP